MEMTKWFDTNYHYIVPEFHEGQTFSLASTKAIDEFQEALSLGIKTKPVLLGPVTFLKLGKIHGAAFDRYTLLPAPDSMFTSKCCAASPAPRRSGCSSTNRPSRST